ncbi:MAG TPA: hypothetical protein VGJ37_13515 [Pyrinomonadaceae bacterium]|jgi:hypothetical protein
MSGLTRADLIGLDNVTRALTGPRCLRSSLRRETAALRSLMVALDGPTELQVRIPVSVFGGDIFGVMSQQLREALVVPLPPAPFALNRQRKHAPIFASNPLAEHPLNPFTPFVDRPRRSTSSSEPVGGVSSETLTLRPAPQTAKQGVTFSPVPQLSCAHSSYHAVETPSISAKEVSHLMAPSRTRYSQATPALVSSLKRYWESVCESRQNNHAPQTAPVSSESFKRAADSSLPDSEHRLTSRAWPALVGLDVAEKLRSFGDLTHVPLKTSRIEPSTDRQIQNIFNIEVKNETSSTRGFDDLAENIAEILHEQALQHGIDVT